MKVLVAAGTRPEAIKLAPVILELRKDATVLFCSTGQHREIFDQALAPWGLQADIDLNLMTPNQQLGALTSAVLDRMVPVMTDFQPDWIVVQGDTTTAMAAALAAFYERRPVAHVEAGLRTGDRFNPFPEEVNRKVIDAVAELMFAPTERAAANLRAEGYHASRVRVTGNTGIDALLQIAQRPESARVQQLLGPPATHRWVLVTTHRRESFGEPLTAICSALLALADRFPDVRFVVPVHPNPNVGDTLRQTLGGRPAFVLTDPLDYPDFVAVMKRACLILTDSGGVQEEAPSLDTPVLVLRDVTERPEGVEAGTARLVGTDPRAIIDEAARLLLDPEACAAMTRVPNPYGDGRASERIASALRQHRLER